MTEVNYLLFRDFMDSIEEARKDIDKHSEYSTSKNNFHLLSERGQYLMKVFNHYCKIQELLCELRQVEVFLRRFPISKFYEKNEIDILAYVKYHTEVFYHKIATILDIMKLMVNEVYELNISDKKCTWEKLVKHLDENKTLELLIISNYHKSFEHLIKARHLNTHKAYYYDDDTDDIRIPLLIYKNQDKVDLEPSDKFRLFHPKFLVDYRIKQFRKKRLNYIKNGNDVAEEYINQFINIILVTIKTKRDLKNNGS